MDVFWTLNRRPHISGFSREQLAPSTHNESAPEQSWQPEQCMRCSVQDCMAEMVSTPWCRPRYGPLTSAHGCYTVQSSGASTTQTQTFWIMGMFPIDAEIDRKSLTFFRNIIKDKNSLEFDICERQLAVKGSKSRSWLIYITALLTKYNLPAPEHMLYSTPTKGAWKTLLLSRIREL